MNDPAFLFQLCMVVFPHCKINLGLRIVSKRADGYHNIETCFYPVPWTDILEIIPSQQFEFTITGLEVAGSIDDNLCTRAYRLLQKDFNLQPVKIHLHKIVPMGAGLGGGSSDAAFTLTTLNSLFELKLTKQQLQHYASMLGSDCSFFTEQVPKIGTGRGEVLHDSMVRLKGFYLVLVKPEIHVSTAEAYRGVKISESHQSLAEILNQPVVDWKHSLINDFEESVFQQHPLLKEIKKQLYQCGAVYAAMSGSGSSIFGLFEKAVDLKNEFADHSYWTGQLKI